MFEWNGSMMHAKTAVADGRWARIGSTNLNLNSWIGNWEMDVAIEDEPAARACSNAQYEEDLARSTEIVDGAARHGAFGARGPGATESARRAMRTSTGLGHSVGAAVSGNRPLEIYESRRCSGSVCCSPRSRRSASGSRIGSRGLSASSSAGPD